LGIFAVAILLMSGIQLYKYIRTKWWENTSK
jgi:hypothetical protein